MNMAGPDPKHYAVLKYFPPQTGVRSVIVAINATIMAMKNIFAILLLATIFIPLTFIVGIYGMNLANMPELQCGMGTSAF